jgi:hypothetical protein
VRIDSVNSSSCRLTLASVAPNLIGTYENNSFFQPFSDLSVNIVSATTIRIRITFLFFGFCQINCTTRVVGSRGSRTARHVGQAAKGRMSCRSSCCGCKTFDLLNLPKFSTSSLKHFL